MNKINKLLLSTTFLFNTINMFACSNSKQFLVYTSIEPQRIELLHSMLTEKFPDYKFYFEYKSTGNLIGQLSFEGNTSQADAILGIDFTSASYLHEIQPSLFMQMDDLINFNDYSEEIYTNYTLDQQIGIFSRYSCSIIYNESLLKEKGLEAPSSYEDLLKKDYSDLIYMPNPKSSGTGYTFYSGVYEYFKGDINKTKNYFTRLSKNVREFTSSGSAPIKNVQRGLGAIGIATTSENYNYSRKDSNLKVRTFINGTPFNLETLIVNNKKVRNNKRKQEIVKYLCSDVLSKDKYLYYPETFFKKPFEHQNKNYDTNIKYLEQKHLSDYKIKNMLLDERKF